MKARKKKESKNKKKKISPAKAAEDEARRDHHHEGHGARRGREVAHERGVVVGVGEGGLELGLPGDLKRENCFFVFFFFFFLP